MYQQYQYNNNNNYQDYSPTRQRYSLSVEDIQGARPRVGPQTKKTNHYEDKLRNQSPVFEERQKMYEHLYSKGNYHEGSIKFNSQKKHFNAHHDSEIAAYDMMKRNEQMQTHIHNVDFPRNLTTEDIPGAKPGSLVSKTVKNHDLAHKIRQGQAIEDSLDKFQQQNRNASPYSPQKSSVEYVPARGGGNYHYQNNYERGQSENPHRRTPVKAQREEVYSPNVHNIHDPREELYSPPIQNSSNSRIPTGNKYKQEESYSPLQIHQVPNSYAEGRRSEVPFERKSDEGIFKAERPKSKGETHQSYQPQNQNIFRENKSCVDLFNPSKKDLISNLSHDIITQQAVLEKKMFDAMRGRAFNIISGGPSSHHIPGYAKQSFGTSIQSMQKNTETVQKPDLANMKHWNPNHPTTLSHSNVNTRNDIGVNNAAGKLNDYAETNYRFAHKPEDQQPLHNDQLYGIRALKNLSGMKLY